MSKSEGFDPLILNKKTEKIVVDGNKRTTWALMVVFLFLNDFKHNFSADEGMDFVLGIATDKISLEQAAELIRRHLVPLS